jgi:ribonuclease HI
MSEIKLAIHTDGGARGNPGPAAIGVHVINEHDEVVFELAKTIGVATNNEAEYQAFVASAEWLKEFAQKTDATISSVEWRLDSMLVVEQLNRRWKLKQLTLKPFFDQAQALLSEFSFAKSIVYVPRERNREADALVNQALDAA